MSHSEKISFAAVPQFCLRIDFAERFGASEALVTERSLPREWIFYAVKEGNVAFLVGGTVYPLEAGDVIMLAPHEIHHLIRYDEKPFRYYRISVDGGMPIALYPGFSHRVLNRKCRFRFCAKDKRALFDLCERLLSSQMQPPHLLAFQFFDLLAGFDAHYSEEDAEIEEYEVCLPLALKKALLFIRNSYKTDFTASALADTSGVTLGTLNKLFREHLQISPKAYLESIRMAAASELLLCGLSESEVARILTYKEVSYFSAVFRKHFGTTPKKYVLSGGSVFLL